MRGATTRVMAESSQTCLARRNLCDGRSKRGADPGGVLDGGLQAPALGQTPQWQGRQSRSAYGGFPQRTSGSATGQPPYMLGSKCPRLLLSSTHYRPGKH